MTRYEEIRHILAQEILTGRYAVGARFPTDHEIRERFGVSRHTVREALRALQEQGLLLRRRGAGTVVGADRPATLFVQTLDSLDELLGGAVATRFERRYEGRMVARQALAETLGCAVGETWLRLAGVRWHREKNIPLCWTEIFVAPPYAAVRDELGDGTVAVHTLLERRFGLRVEALEQEISAVALGAEPAAQLDAPAGTPGLLVLRRYFAEGRRLFEAAFSLYPGDRFTFKSHLSRSE